MRNLANEFKNKKISYDKLLNYGFILKKDEYIYEKLIANNNFKVVISLSKEKQTSKLIDLELNNEYVLVDVDTISGEFVGHLKEEYERIINDIVSKCTSPNIFKSHQSQEIIKYVKEKYNDDLEYLWEKFPNNAVWRNKETKNGMVPF